MLKHFHILLPVFVAAIVSNQCVIIGCICMCISCVCMSLTGTNLNTQPSLCCMCTKTNDSELKISLRVVQQHIFIFVLANTVCECVCVLKSILVQRGMVMVAETNVHLILSSVCAGLVCFSISPLALKWLLFLTSFSDSNKVFI